MRRSWNGKTEGNRWEGKAMADLLRVSDTEQEERWREGRGREG